MLAFKAEIEDGQIEGGQRVELTESEKRLLAAQKTVHTAIVNGETTKVFLALRAATSDTDLRVGRTEIEDPNTITASRIADYLIGLEDCEEAELELWQNQNGYSEEEASQVYTNWRINLYERIASELSKAS